MMKSLKCKIVLLVFLVILQLTGCGSDNEYTTGYGESSWSDNTEDNADSWDDDAEDETGSGFSEQEADIPSPVEGDWYMFDPVKRKDFEPAKVTFKDNVVSPAEGYEYTQEIPEELEMLAILYENIPYEYDEQKQILTLDYTIAFQELENLLKQENDEESKEELESLEKMKRENSGGLMELYLQFYDDMMFLYGKYSEADEVNAYLEYDNPNFPNSSRFLEKEGKYFTLAGVGCRKAEYPNIRSMTLALGQETIAECLCKYYANWADAFSIGFLEKVYGIYDSDLITVNREIVGDEFDPSRVDDENLSLDNIEDVPREDDVWKLYEECPLEEVKYVTYSHDTDSGRQTSGIYMGKTCGLWSVLWTNGDL